MDKQGKKRKVEQPPGREQDDSPPQPKKLKKTSHNARHDTKHVRNILGQLENKQHSKRMIHIIQQIQNAASRRENREREAQQVLEWIWKQYWPHSREWAAFVEAQKKKWNPVYSKRYSEETLAAIRKQGRFDEKTRIGYKLTLLNGSTFKDPNIVIRANETYTHASNPKVKKNGFHFCAHPLGCLKYRPQNAQLGECKLWEVRADGIVDHDPELDRLSTDKLSVVREIVGHERESLLSGFHIEGPWLRHYVDGHLHNLPDCAARVHLRDGSFGLSSHGKRPFAFCGIRSSAFMDEIEFGHFGSLKETGESVVPKSEFPKGFDVTRWRKIYVQWCMPSTITKRVEFWDAKDWETMLKLKHEASVARSKQMPRQVSYHGISDDDIPMNRKDALSLPRREFDIPTDRYRQLKLSDLWPVTET